MFRVRPIPYFLENCQSRCLKVSPVLTNDPVAPWWSPPKHADRRPILLGRNRIELAARGYFAEHDFLLVDPPGLQRSPGNETHLHAFATTMIGNDGTGETMYLATSPPPVEWPTWIAPFRSSFWTSSARSSA